MHNYPYFFEEKIREHNQELKEIESNSWKWSRSASKKSKPTILTVLLALIGLKL